jgi:hypothetical protein
MFLFSTVGPMPVANPAGTFPLATVPLFHLPLAITTLFSSA